MQAVTEFFSQNISFISKQNEIRIAASISGIALGLFVLDDVCWHSYYESVYQGGPDTSSARYALKALAYKRSKETLRLFTVNITIGAFALAVIAYSGFSLAGRVKAIF